MRKMMLLAVMVAMAALMLAAAPAMADDNKHNDNDWKKNDWKKNDWKKNDWKDNDWKDNDWKNNNHHKRFFDDCEFDDLEFDFEQDADSGDVDQTFIVTNTGDNSNQCVGLQGVANTGNAQNQLGLTQLGSDADDFDFDDVNSSIEVSPTNVTTCDQEVNQAATAYYNSYW